MTRGAKPVPRNIRILQGNPHHKPIDPDIPDPPLIKAGPLPDPPEILTEPARKHWVTFAAQLRDMRVLTEPDYPSLCMLCESYANYWEAMRLVRKHGITSVSNTGRLIQSEHLNAAHKSLDKCMKIMTEFGLTPSSRMRVRST